MTEYTLKELQDLRLKWLNEGLDTGVIAGAIDVARYLGQPLDIRGRGTENKRLVLDKYDLEITHYLYDRNYFMVAHPPDEPTPTLDRVSTLVVKWHGVAYCRWSTCTNPQEVQGLDWPEAVFIPGAWTQVVLDLVPQAQAKKDKESEHRHDTEIQRLRTMLLLD